MENTRMLVDALLICGMTLAALMVFVLLKTRARFSQRLLAIFFGSGFFFLLYYYSFVHRSSVLGAIALLFGNGMGFLLGPVLYFYIKSITLDKARLAMPLLRQLIPFFVFWAFVSLPLSLNLLRPGWLEGYTGVLSVNFDGLNLLENAYLLAYCLFSLRLVSRLKRVYSDNFSAPEHQNLDWCAHLVRGLAAIVIVDCGLSVYELAYPPEEVVWNIGLVIAFAFVGFFAYLGYRGMFQAQILLPDFLVESEFPNRAAPGNRAKPTSSLAAFDETEIHRLQERLTYLLEEEKLYLDENLTLGALAANMDISDKKLSELLNKFSKTNFYNLINDYRIAHAKKLLLDPQNRHLTLVALGFDSGFNSKTSFNRVFKQKTGMSPSAFKREHGILQVEKS